MEKLKRKGSLFKRPIFSLERECQTENIEKDNKNIVINLTLNLSLQKEDYEKINNLIDDYYDEDSLNLNL